MKRKILIFVWVLIFIFIISLPVQAQYIKRDVSKIQIGMTTDEVKNALGRPQEINRRSGPKGETQQWVYREGREQYLFLYFENDIYTGEYSRYGERPSRLP